MATVEVREVCASNLEGEFAAISEAVFRHGCRYAAMDTEFPGTIFPYNFKAEKNTYLPMKKNVDSLKIIQLGLALADEFGNLFDFGTGRGVVWQFNFRDFDLERDAHNQDSVELLKKQGIDFTKNAECGIDSRDFGRLLAKSGLIWNRRITWVTFQGSYDLGLLVKILTGGLPLPHNLQGFMMLTRHFFGPNFIDLKYVLRFCDGLYGGLDRIASALQVERAAGQSHQAGSDSLLTLHTFGKAMKVKFSDGHDLPHGCRGVLNGLKEDAITTSVPDLRRMVPRPCHPIRVPVMVHPCYASPAMLPLYQNQAMMPPCYSYAYAV